MSLQIQELPAKPGSCLFLPESAKAAGMNLLVNAIVAKRDFRRNRHFFSKQVPAFAEKYHVLTFDLRGHGDSDIFSLICLFCLFRLCTAAVIYC